jgi:hypothetical protein
MEDTKKKRAKKDEAEAGPSKRPGGRLVFSCMSPKLITSRSRRADGLCPMILVDSLPLLQTQKRRARRASV